MGQVIKMRTYPAVDNHCCAAPNADTLYTEVWLDVSGEPWVFSIPDMGDRYYMMPMLNGYSEVIDVAGSHTTGGKAQTYAITGPGWSGALPQGVTEVKSHPPRWLFVLEDPESNRWVVKSMSLITHPDQKFDELGTLGSRLKLPPGWKFRAPVLAQDLVLTPDKDGIAHITQDDFGNTYDRAGGPYSNVKP